MMTSVSSIAGRGSCRKAMPHAATDLTLTEVSHTSQEVCLEDTAIVSRYSYFASVLVGTRRSKKRSRLLDATKLPADPKGGPDWKNASRQSKRARQSEPKRFEVFSVARIRPALTAEDPTVDGASSRHWWVVCSSDVALPKSGARGSRYRRSG
jgi:hypothetical protein